MPDWHDAPPAYEEALQSSVAGDTSTSSHGANTSGALAPPLPPRTQQPSPAPSTPQPGTPVQYAPSPRPPASPVPAAQRAGPLPTSTHQPGHPLLNEGRLLVYPVHKGRCEKCGNTGYKGGDPSRPCSRCWRKYGRAYSGALKQAYEGTGLASVLQGMSLQRPLPGAVNYTHPNMVHQGTQPVGYVANQSYMPYAPYAPYRPAAQYVPPAAAQAPAEPERFPEDQHSSAPPRYEQASASDKPLPDQQYPQQHAPPPQAPQVPQPVPAPQPMPGGWGAAQPAPMGPTHYWPGYAPPPGAVRVMPGDPRIGGILCPECYGSGDDDGIVSLFLGGGDCRRCGGTGRIGHGGYV